MLKKISLSMLSGAFLLFNSTLTFATNHVVLASYNIDYELNINIPEFFPNPTLSTLEGHCRIEVPDEVTTLAVDGVSPVATNVDGQNIGRGTHIRLEVHNNQVIRISAPKGAGVNLTNLGLQKIIAHCEGESK